MNPRQTFRNLSEEKQERITRVALEEFGEKGYAGASINFMVERLGIAKGSVFQYFGDKKGLFLFVFNKTTDMVKDYLRAVRDQTKDEDLFTRLEATLMAGSLFLREHPLIYRVYIKVMYEYDVPFRKEILQALREHSLKFLRSLLETAKERGELKKDLDLNRMAFVLDALMDRFLQAHMVPHLDAGLGLYQCDESVSAAWVKELTAVIRAGIGQ